MVKPFLSAWKEPPARKAGSADRPKPAPHPLPPKPWTAGPPRLYTLQVFLTDGPVAKKFSGEEISRMIQMRGDQTLQALHKAIFKAFDREESFYSRTFGPIPIDSLEGKISPRG